MTDSTAASWFVSLEHRFTARWKAPILTARTAAVGEHSPAVKKKYHLLRLPNSARSLPFLSRYATLGSKISIFWFRQNYFTREKKPCRQHLVPHASRAEAELFQ